MSDSGVASRLGEAGKHRPDEIPPSIAVPRIEPRAAVTKVMLPRRRSDVLSRPRLVDFLNQHLDRKLILVCAPPGYGKTTVLVDFAHQAGMPVCWFSLTIADADPQVFLEYFVLSVRQRFPDFGSRTLGYLQTAGAKDLQVAVGLVLGELQDVTPDPLMLVLDDVQNVDESPTIQTLLDLLIGGMPQTCCCVLASRTIPRIRLSRLVANREAAGLGDADLRFTADEIQQLFGRYYNVLVPDALAEELANDVEGWIAGLILTSHSLWQGLFKGIIQAKRAGGPIFDYLATEVFDNQDSDIQEFLLGASVLARLNPESCDQVLGRADSTELLEVLDRKNLFLSHLGNGWYRFHSLFQEFLQARFEATNESEFRRLHLRAAELAEAENDVESAIDHYLKAGEPEGAARRAELGAAGLIEGGRLRTLLRWCEQLPAGAMVGHFTLQVARARAAIELGELATAEAALQTSLAEARAVADTHAIASALVWRSALHQVQGEFPAAVKDCQAALAMARELGDAELETLSYRRLGISYGALGESEQAIEALERALTGYVRSGDVFNQATIRHSLGIALSNQGSAIRAREELEHALRLWVAIGNRGLRAGTLVVLGNLRWDLGQLAEAEEAQLEAQQEAESSGYLRLEGYAAESLGDVLRDRRKFERSQQAYERGLMIAEKVGDRFLQVVALDGLARCYLYAGSAGLAYATIARARLLADERESPYEQGLCADTLGLFYLVDGRLDLASRELERAHGQLESRSSVREQARVKLHLGLALLRRGDRERALELGQTALRLLPAQAQEPLLAVEGEWLSELLQLVGSAGPAWLADLVELPSPHLSAARPKVVSPNRAIQCFTLGRSDVELDGSPIGGGEWQTQKAKELWFYLLANGPAPRNQLIEALWPDSQLAKGLSALHTTLHRLRRTLFLGCVERQGELYGISSTANVWSDDREFEAAAVALRRLETVDLSEEQLAGAAKAVNLYRGPYLESIDAAWCDTRRQRLQVLYLRLLRSLVEQAHLAQHYEQAISFAELYLQTEPDDEGIHELIMRSHALDGNRSAALRHYQRYAQQLRDELATQPSRRLRSLVDQISGEG